jgi:ubiquinone/menaquinone biosynthesis C-methylase UbiE
MTNERRFNGKIQRLRSPERIERFEPDKVIDLCLADISAHSMLDIGTGSGLFAERFHGRGLSVYGVDVNPDMLEAAEHFVPEGTFVEAAMESLPFEENRFDLVFMGCVLHEADDFVKALSEARRVTRQRVCVLEYPYRRQPFGPPMNHRLTEDRIRDFSAQAGFKDVQVHQRRDIVVYIFS